MNLDILRETIVALVRSDRPDLSARQQGVLLSVATTDGPHTVRGLAQLLHISKPAVTRSLDRLEQHEFVRRVADKDDRRSVLIEMLPKGQAHVKAVRTALQAAQKAAA